MRIKAALIVLATIGAVFAAGRLAPDQALAPSRLEKVRAACPDCHGEVPEYRAAIQVHDKHAAFECRRCHGEAGTLRTAGRIHTGFEGILIGVALLILAGLAANQWIINRETKTGSTSESRTVRRFRARSILVHWLHAASFSAMMITGAIMFFDLADMAGGRFVRTIHQSAAISFGLVPLLFLLYDPPAAIGFLKEAFRWSRSDRAWFKASLAFYFCRPVKAPRQDYINGDQRLWQLVSAVTGLVFVATGVPMSLFKLKVPLEAYQWIRLAHAGSFVLATSLFLVHLYLALLHPRFEESMGSMVDGMVSPSYARDHYADWYERVGEDGRARTGAADAPEA